MLRLAQFQLRVRTQLDDGPIGETTIDERYAPGIETRQGNAEHWSQRELAPSGAETLNLQTLLAGDRRPLAAVAVVDLVIVAAETNRAPLRLTPAAAEPWVELLGAEGRHDLRPGAALLLHSPIGAYPVAPSSRQFDIENLGAESATYTLHVIVRRGS
jgi:hypothetical protein